MNGPRAPNDSPRPGEAVKATQQSAAKCISSLEASVCSHEVPSLCWRDAALRKPQARVVPKSVVWIALAHEPHFSSSECVTPALLVVQKHTTRSCCLDECGSDSDGN